MQEGKTHKKHSEKAEKNPPGQWKQQVECMRKTRDKNSTMKIPQKKTKWHITITAESRNSKIISIQHLTSIQFRQNCAEETQNRPKQQRENTVKNSKGEKRLLNVRKLSKQKEKTQNKNTGNKNI